MKIALVLDDGLDTTDGVQQYILHVGGWLSTQGHEVHYVVGQTARTDLANVHSMSRNVHVKFNGNRMSVPLPAKRTGLRSLLAREQFDVVHVQVPYSPFMAGRLLRMLPETTAAVGTFHILPYSWFVLLANRGLALLNALSGRRFDQMLAVSVPAEHFAKRVYGYEARVVPNPIDIARFSAASSTDTTLNIVFLGRLVERKGALHLLRAVAYLRERELYMQPFRVVIGGKGELLGTLQQFVSDYNMQDTVTFQGFVPETDKPAFLAQADIAVYPSLSGESFGIVLLEAMAAGRGVVLGGNNPGYASVLAPYPDQLFDPKDTVAFAHKLAAYLANQVGRERASVLQHQYVQKFDSTIVGGELLAIYTKALQDRRPS